MKSDPPPRIEAPGWGEVPPTAGLLPYWPDLFASGDPTLETALARHLGFDEIDIVSTGTAGLLIAFTWLKQRFPARTTVVVPGYTCPLVVLAAAAAGLRSIACDTKPGSFDLDPAQLARVLDQRTLAVVPTHYGGALTDVDAVRRVTKAVSPDIAIVEDAAQALGATWAGRSVGHSGDLGVFSLGTGKGLTIYEGGVLVASDAATSAALRATAVRLATAAPSGEFARCAMLAGYHAAYNPLGLRLAYGAGKRRALSRDDEIGAAGDRFAPDITVSRVGGWRKRVGAAALHRLDAHLAASRARFNALATRLEAIPGIRVHRPAHQASPSATFLFVTMAEHPEREALIRSLWTSRLGVARMFSRAIGDYPDLASHMLPSPTPNARALAAGTLTISTSPLLSPTAEAAIVATFEGFALANRPP